MPPNRSYFVFAGLEQVLLFLENMKFSEEHISYLKEKKLDAGFLEYLRGSKFTGEVWSVPEGTIVFPEEPLIRVTAPVIETQLIETFILNTVNLQTMIATKASRVIWAAKPVLLVWLKSKNMCVRVRLLVRVAWLKLETASRSLGLSCCGTLKEWGEGVEL